MSRGNGGGIGNVEHGDRLEEGDNLVQRGELNPASSYQSQLGGTRVFEDRGDSPWDRASSDDEPDAKDEYGESEGVGNRVEEGRCSTSGARPSEGEARGHDSVGEGLMSAQGEGRNEAEDGRQREEDDRERDAASIDDESV